MRAISVIVATTPRGGIGMAGALPWRIPEDMAHFKRVTMAAEEGESKVNAVIMGRRTWDSIPEKFRPLPGRINVVLTKEAAKPGFTSTYPEGVLVAASVANAADMLSARDDVGEIFVIGGQAAYQEAVELPSCQHIFVTRVGKDVECDAFFPAFDETKFRVASVSKTSSHKELSYDFVVYERVPEAETTALPKEISTGEFLHEEYQYLNAIREIIEQGVHSGDRTGTGTRSMFGKMSRWDLRKTFPLLTTKRVFWRGVVEELLWFVKGDTNANHLAEKGIKIWDGNGSREFLDKRGLSHREEGDLGPVYGFQWRHFGAEYKDMHADYTGQGVDQLAECIDKIKNDPTDRRILLSAWNPADLHLMALPPCHMFCQFYVANGELSCLMYSGPATWGSACRSTSPPTLC